MLLLSAGQEGWESEARIRLWGLIILSSRKETVDRVAETVKKITETSYFIDNWIST